MPPGISASLLFLPTEGFSAMSAHFTSSPEVRGQKMTEDSSCKSPMLTCVYDCHVGLPCVCVYINI